MCELMVCKNCNEQKSPDFFSMRKRRGVYVHEKRCKKCISDIRSIKSLSEEQKAKIRLYWREKSKRVLKDKKRQTNQRRRESEKYSQWLVSYKNKIREQLLERRTGELCVITPVFCARCKLFDVRKGIATKREGVGMLCNTCSKSTFGIKIKRPIKEKVCNACEAVYMGDPRSQFCKNCAVKRERGRGTNLVQRARRYGVLIEAVNPYTVFSRDAWRCCDCGCEVVKTKQYQKNQATVDHIVPLSKGGSHTYDNVRTLCIMCNSIKGNKLVSTTNETQCALKGMGAFDR